MDLQRGGGAHDTHTYTKKKVQRKNEPWKKKKEGRWGQRAREPAPKSQDCRAREGGKPSLVENPSWGGREQWISPRVSYSPGRRETAARAIVSAPARRPNRPDSHDLIFPAARSFWIRIYATAAAAHTHNVIDSSSLESAQNARDRRAL